MTISSSKQLIFQKFPNIPRYFS